ncbi:hypothetical protein GCM10009641_61680 [Mycobacterium cookii]|uniref:Uncharacterized protein n=1 Tax=Nocardioides furvisabuli TaxID=375542 RepID=A0ABN2XBH9_9ACTN
MEDEGVDRVLVHFKAVAGERLQHDPFELGDVVRGVGRLYGVELQQPGLRGGLRERVPDETALVDLGALDAQRLAVADEDEPVLGEEDASPAEVALDRRRADLEALGELVDVDGGPRRHQITQHLVQALGRPQGFRRVGERHERGRRRPGSGPQPVAPVRRLDEAGTGRFVECRDVVAHAARRNAEVGGQVSGRHPRARPAQPSDQSLVPIHRHLTFIAPRRGTSVARQCGAGVVSAFRNRGKWCGGRRAEVAARS